MKKSSSNILNAGVGLFFFLNSHVGNNLVVSFDDFHNVFP